ncbi:MAG: S9 family peptidase [Bacteroidales bacterium]|nr:S9 family peptidase [Bacteroidales bacterium]
MKYLKQITILSILMWLAITADAQDKKALTFDDILKWNRITEKTISNDGSLVAYKLEPWKGDPVLKLIENDGSPVFTQTGGSDIRITEDSRFLLSRIKPLEDTIRQLKLQNINEEDMPEDQLLILNIQSGEKETIDNLKSFKIPEKWSGWAAYQTKPEEEKDTTVENKHGKEASSENGYPLHIKKLPGETVQFPCVTDYLFAEEKEVIAFVSTGNEDFKAGVYQYDLAEKNLTPVMQGDTKHKQLNISEDGSLIAFLSDSTTTKEEKDFALYLWDGQGNAGELVNNNNAALPEDWKISEHGALRFSQSKERLFFGTAPELPEKDTTKPEDEIPVVDVWHWDEPVLHSRQLNNREENLKKSYVAVYHLDQDKMVQLENEDFTGIKLIDDGDAEKALAWSYLPYAVRRMWEGYPYHNDFYLVDMQTGKAEMFKKDCRATPDVSPNGEYVYWYNALDTTWVTYNIASGEEFTVTEPENIQVANELNDRPHPPRPYGTPDWLEDDKALLVYDRFDIWKVDPENREEPVNLTENGRKTKTKYRLIDYRTEDEKKKGLEESETYHLHGHNIETRGEGYYELKLKSPGEPKQLLGGKYSLNNPVKAKDKDVYVYTQETFQQFPDLQITKNFRKSARISNANPQQEEFKWGTIELYNWISADGRKLEGLLVKPEDFDPDKKYPLIVNFYEKSSQGLYNHRTPEVHRSTIDYHYYTSNDYIIFNPDVYYGTGYPGEDAFNCVMTGITQLISKGFIDEDHIAAQGHSWGGYQVAYLATRTDMFAAIESGAPVVNMFSAYGGIRENSGLNRSFQYEQTQSRIGKSIWEAPHRYLENSPLFWADKISTPMLIMHNEDDGAVPFSQGVELFIAMRRLRKPAWLLNYNEADHWPTKIRDKYDFQIRMSQFFEHYLKEKPMPEWMKEGIPAVEKGRNMGY